MKMKISLSVKLLFIIKVMSNNYIEALIQENRQLKEDLERGEVVFNNFRQSELEMQREIFRLQGEIGKLKTRKKMCDVRVKHLEERLATMIPEGIPISMGTELLTYHDGQFHRTPYSPSMR
jgi:hypothetical protein